MRDLIELTNIVTKTKIRSVELVGSAGDRSSKLQEFYDLIADGRFTEDDEVAGYLYSADKKAPAYQKLRKTLKDRLINSLFIIDLKQPSYTDRQRAYYECYREWAAAKILFGKNARTTAESIARKLFKIARRFEFTELLVDICHTMRLYHGTIDGDFRKYQQYNESFKIYEQIWKEENRAEEYYIELSIGFVNSKSTKTSFQDKAREYYKVVEDTLQRYDSYQLHLCGRLIEVSIYTSVNDYEGTLDVCDRAIAFFEDKKYVASVPLQVFWYQKCICHAQLRQFEQMRASVEKCLQYLEEGKFNWFKVYELLFLFYSHNEEYEKAQAIMEKVTAHPNYLELPDNIRETWKISEGYLAFLERAGQLKKRKAEPFRMARFRNEMQVFTRDKRGMNVPILILELLHGIAGERYDELIDRVEAIDKYRTRYLKEEELARSNYFLKMLLQAPRNAYRRAEVEAKAAADYEDLQAIPIEMANQAFEIEIVPYEKLWTYLLEMLPG